VSARTVVVTRSLLLRAARFLEREAKGLYNSCKSYSGAPWACGDCHEKLCAPHREHDEMAKAARELREKAA